MHGQDEAIDYNSMSHRFFGTLLQEQHNSIPDCNALDCNIIDHGYVFIILYTYLLCNVNPRLTNSWAVELGQVLSSRFTTICSPESDGS